MTEKGAENRVKKQSKLDSSRGTAADATSVFSSGAFPLYFNYD